MSAWLKIKESGVLTDRTDYLAETHPPQFTLTRGARGAASITLRVATGDAYVPLIGWQVFLYEVTGSGSSAAFAGSIDTCTLTYESDLGYRIYAISCVAFEQCLDTLQISPRVYATGTAWGTIVADILATTCAGVPFTSGTISAGANLAGPLIIDLDSPSAIFDKGAQESNLIWYIDPDALTINFRASSAHAAPFTLLAADVLWASIQWEQTRHDFRNRQVVRRAFEASNPTVDFFTGTGIATAFTLRYPLAKGVLGKLTQSTIATAIGTMTAQPSAGDTVSIQGATGYWVTTLDNTSSQGQVKIGATIPDSIQALIDAINAEPSSAGIRFNLPTGEQGATWAGGWAGSGPYTFTLSANWPGTDWNSIALGATGVAFSWNTATLTGGTGTGGTDTGVNIVTDRAGTVPTGVDDLLVEVGSTTITFAVAPPSDRYISFAYYRLGADCVAVEDTPLVAARAAIEGGTGKYQAEITDTSLTDGGAALVKAQSALTFYKTLPITFKFQTDRAGLMPGQYLAVTLTGAPVGAAALIDGNWLIQELQGDCIPGVEFLRSGGGHFRYTVSVISSTVIGTDIAFWQDLQGGSGGGGSSSGGSGSSGGGSTAPEDGYHTITPSGGNATVELGNGLNQRLVLDGSAVDVNAPSWAGGSIVAGVKLWLYLDQDATGSRALPTFTGGVGGFVSSTAAQIQIDPTASTRTSLAFKFHGSYWALDSQLTGATLT